ncbi:MAG: hypothetical protein GXO40_03415 [Epsilonproteobacteria bacterium]|nr:hypothetical protein [Campylobacterota bacterium]
MPWYSVIIILFLLGCQNIQIGKKSFADEDNFIMQGLLYEDKNITKSINIFKQLYDKTGKYVYYKKIIELTFQNKNYKKTIKLVDNFIKNYPKHQQEVFLYKIYSYLELNQPQLALKYAQDFLKTHRNLQTYEIIAYIYIKLHKYKLAINYLKSAYAISHSVDVLAKMGDVFFKYLKKPNEAVSYYQTHIRLHGCNVLICNRLAQIYKYLYDYDNLIAIYKKLYEHTLDTQYANKVVYLYLEQEQYKKAIKFIQENKLNKSLLYLVYKSRLNKKQTYKDAYKLYKYTGDYKYFFLYTVYKFQQSKKSIELLRNVIANLEILVKNHPNPLYLNYLGYILIDYDIDVKRGIKLVKQALKTMPHSKAFLDSLAWGYYKLHQCKQAYDIIKRIKSKDKEILYHKKMIRRCYDTRYNHKKNKRKSQKR